MNFIKYVFNYKNVMQQIKEAENMITNYKISLEKANHNIEEALKIIEIRDKELQEWDDANTALIKELQELKGKAQPTEEQIKAAERFRKSFDDLLNYNKKAAIRRK